MISAFKAERPSVGIFWVVEPMRGKPRLLTAGCSHEAGGSYGDCLSFEPGHYNVWTKWRHDCGIDADHRAIVCSSEYED
jgi:hypothetical protein